MSKPTDVYLKQIRCSTEQIDYRTPIKFGGRVVKDAVLFNVTVEAETRDGRLASGLGSMPIGNVWAWPTNAVSGETTLAAMTEFAKRAVDRAGDYSASGHPLEMTHALAQEHATIAAEIEKALSLVEPIPRLAQLVAASPLEAEQC